MISNINFYNAVYVLETLTSPDAVLDKPIQFEPEYQVQHPVLTALKILNKAAQEGSDEQKTELLNSRHKIVSLNNLLKSNSFSDNVKEKLKIDISENIIKGIQISLPQTTFERMIEIASLIPRIIITILFDILLLPGALVLLLVACCKSNIDPKAEDVKQGKPAILLLHGSGFNQEEYVVGKQFLKNEQYGAVFSMNYDGLVSNDPSKGIDDYAKEEIRPEIKKIKELTGCDRIIIIGHSMGGLIGGYYAEYLAETDGVKVEHVMSLATPWQGTPMIDCFWKLGGCCSKEKETKRHQQMSISGGTEEEPDFRQKLVAKALESERKGVRKYYNIWSTTDYAVPNAHGCLTEDSRRQRSFSYLGHYALVAWPWVWLQARSWLDEIYISDVAVQDSRELSQAKFA